MELLASELGKRGVKSQKWTAFAGDGITFSRICRAIHSNDVIIAEISSLNLNVMFEVGYAIGVGRDPILLLKADWDRPGTLNILQTKYQCHYRNRMEIAAFVTKYFRERGYESMPSRTVALMIGIDLNSEQERGVHFIPAMVGDTASGLQRLLEQKKKERIIQNLSVSDPDDSLFDSFAPQARLIAAAQHTIILLASEKTRGAQEKNAPAALLAGLAAGLGKEILILQERPARPLLDVGTILHQFEGEFQAKRILSEWLGNRPDEESVKLAIQPGSDMNPGSLDATRQERRARRARSRFFGQPDATVDHDLMDYFIETPEFSAALTGQKELLVGR